MEWMLLPLKRYADFSGRSRRKEYWMFFLGYMIVFIVLGVLSGMLGGSGDMMMSESGEMMGEPSTGSMAMMMLLGIIALGLIIPSLAVQVRRFHDQDKSGWMVLLAFIPIVGGLIVLVFMCLEGTRGPNRFGPDPKGAGEAEAFT